MNCVNLVGRLTADPELKYTAAGVAVCNMRVAIKDPFTKGEDGKPGADFFDCTAWRENAEHCSEYLEKGREVAITGRLKNNSWTTEAGEKRTKTVIQIDRIDFVGGRPDGAKKGGGGAEPGEGYE